MVFKTSKSCKSSACQVWFLCRALHQESLDELPLQPLPLRSHERIRDAAVPQVLRCVSFSRFCRNQCRYRSLWVLYRPLLSTSLASDLLFPPKTLQTGFAIVCVSLSFRSFLLKWIWTSIPWRLQNHSTTSLKERLHRRSSCSSRRF